MTAPNVPKIKKAALLGGLLHFIETSIHLPGIQRHGRRMASRNMTTHFETWNILSTKFTVIAKMATTSRLTNPRLTSRTFTFVLTKRS